MAWTIKMESTTSDAAVQGTGHTHLKMRETAASEIGMAVADSVLSPSGFTIFLRRDPVRVRNWRMIGVPRQACELMLPCACLNHARTQTQTQAGNRNSMGPRDVPSDVSCPSSIFYYLWIASLSACYLQPAAPFV